MQGDVGSFLSTTTEGGFDSFCGQTSTAELVSTSNSPPEFHPFRNDDKPAIPMSNVQIRRSPAPAHCCQLIIQMFNSLVA
jgi:hypothetical protein